MDSGPGPYFEDVEVGDELPTLTKDITLEQMAMYAAACWDFRPIHYDSGSAQALGFRNAFTDGPMTTAFLAQVVTDWTGVNGCLRKITATYRGMTFTGDRLVCKAKVVGKRREVDGNVIECEVWAETPRGERVVYGTAIVGLPGKVL
ncbi:MaoC/PaaZ C-terminal domain-containing protein [Chloroflexota bacterium]